MGVHNDGGSFGSGGMIAFSDRDYIDAEIKKRLKQAKTYADSKAGTSSLYKTIQVIKTYNLIQQHVGNNR